MRSVMFSMNGHVSDEDGDGFYDVYCNTTEGMWTDVPNFLHPFIGVHKKNLTGYIALFELRCNLKPISPSFIAQLVTLHSELYMSQ